MKNIVKYCLLLILLASTSSALSSSSALPDTHKRLVQKMIDILALPNTQKVKDKVYKKFSPFLTNDGQWNVHWTSNKSASNSKIEKAEVKFCNLTLYNKNRAVVYNFIHFKKQKQLVMTQKEFVETTSENVLDRFNKMKKDKEYTKEEENDNYAYFQLKGYMDYTAYHVKTPVGMIVYQSTIFMDIEDEDALEPFSKLNSTLK